MDILPQLIVNSVVAGALYGLMALGFNFIYSTVKFFDLSYGAVAAVGSYAAFYFLKTLGLSPYLGIPLSVLVSAVLGFFLYKVIYVPLRSRRASNTVLLVASLGVFTVLQALLAIFFGSQFQTLSDNTINGRVFDVFSGAITGTQILIVCAVFAVLISLALLLKFTLFGKAVKAVGDDEEVSKIVGINTSIIIGKVFFIGSAIAGIGGILAGFDTGIEPTMGLPLFLSAVVASIVGGIGNIYGAVAGAFLLGFIENFGIWFVSGEWKSAIAFALLIIFLIFRPQGIFNK